MLAFISQKWSARGGRRRWNIADVACIVLLVVFSGSRFEVGTDYPVYQASFDRLDPTQDWFQQAQAYGQDLGYTFLGLATRLVTSDPHSIFWVTSVLAIVPVYLVLRKQSIDLPFSILLYILLTFYVSPFNIIRQGIAVALMFWAYSFLRDRKLVYLLIAIVASLFHATAIIAAIAMFLGRYWRPRWWSVITLFAVAVALTGAIWTLPVVRNIVESLNGRYLDYVDTGSPSGGGIMFYVKLIMFIAMLVPIALALDKENRDWFAILCIGAAVLILSVNSPVLLRAFDYFGIFVVLALPNALARLRARSFLRFGYVLVSAAYFFVYVQNFADLVPYTSYFQGNFAL